MTAAPTPSNGQVGKAKPANPVNDFRRDLEKIMPGYQWTVHRSSTPETYLEATGIQSSGFNRLSTLHITRKVLSRTRDVPWYEVKSAGFGKRAPWLHTTGDVTLAKALRCLQQHYESMANTYRGHAAYLQSARTAPSHATDDGADHG